MNSMFDFSLAPYELLAIFVAVFLGISLLMYLGFRPKSLGFGKLRIEAKDEMQHDQSLLYNIDRGIRNIDTITRRTIRNNAGIEVRQIVREIVTGCSASRLAIELVLNSAIEAVVTDNHFTAALQTDAGRNDMINEIRASLNSRLPYDLSTDFCKESRIITDACRDGIVERLTEKLIFVIIQASQSGCRRKIDYYKHREGEAKDSFAKNVIAQCIAKNEGYLEDIDRYIYASKLITTDSGNIVIPSAQDSK
ncbi:hypothetical protein FACS189443_1760 [Planctomycetales bacterium]|nr:hypothetical protein FACS189443_1760 [Planctomycetales bacterium]